MTTVVQRLGDTQGARNVDGMFHVFRFVSMIANEHITTKVSVSIVGNCVAQTLVRSASGHFSMANPMQLLKASVTWS